MKDVLFIVLLLLGVTLFVMVFRVAEAQDPDLNYLKRDEHKAKAIEEYNPLIPLRKATQFSLDYSLNQVLPFRMMVNSQLTRDEQDCWREARENLEADLKKARNPLDKGKAWNSYKERQAACPHEAAKRTDVVNGPFQAGDRYPAGTGF